MSAPTHEHDSSDPTALRSRAEASLGQQRDLSAESPDLHRLVHELRVHQTELELQNEELRRTELELITTRDRYRELYEQAPVGYVTLDPVGRILDANLTLCQHLGRERPWLVGRALASLMSEAHADAFHLHLRAVRGGAGHATCEVGLRHVGGATLPVRLDSTASRGASAEQGQVLTAVVDLSDLRHAEDEARTHVAKAQTLLDTTTDGILTLDAEGRIEAANAAALRMFGYDRGSLVGRSVRTLLSPPIPHRLERYLATGRGDDDEVEPVLVQGRRHDGGELPLELGFGTWHDHGEPKLTVLLRDISERRRAEQRLRESEARMREIATHVDDVLYVREHGGRLTYVSPGYQAIWGRPTSSALDDPRGWLDFVDPRDQAMVEGALLRLARGEPIDVEYRIERADAATRWIRDHASPVRDAAGEVLRYVGVARDITKQRQLEDELRQAFTMEAVDTLASGVAHDFRNLLHGIAGCVALAERNLDEPRQVRSYLAKVRDATRRGATLTDQLTSFSRRQDGDHGQPLVLDALVESSAPLLMRLMGEQVGLVLQLEAPAATVAADPVQIERILMNVASNACDAMPSGGTLVIRTRTVTVDEGEPRAHAGGVSGPCVRLEISDTGVGMDDATREHIFEPFFTTKAFGKGAGLGLAAVFGITHTLGGHVAVDSTPGMGSTFTFWFPRCSAQIAQSALVEPVEGGSEPDERPVPSTTVLLVEDDPLVRMAIRNDLEGLGLRVVEAHDPPHALSLVDTLQPPPDLLLSDVMMPHMTGPRLADELCARLPELRLLLVSAHSAEDLVARGTVRPGVPLLRKPFGAEQLRQRVLDVLRREPTGPAPTPSPSASPSASPGPGTILLVEDDEGGRTALTMLLEDEGIHVLAAADPAQALRVAAAWTGTIDLLLTDVNLPKMRGDALARRVLASRPERIEVLYLSGGHPPDDLDPKAPLLLKPIAFEVLVQQVRALLRAPGPNARA